MSDHKAYFEDSPAKRTPKHQMEGTKIGKGTRFLTKSKTRQNNQTLSSIGPFEDSDRRPPRAQKGKSLRHVTSPPLDDDSLEIETEGSTHQPLHIHNILDLLNESKESTEVYEMPTGMNDSEPIQKLLKIMNKVKAKKAAEQDL